MIDLALRERAGPVALAAIAGRRQVLLSRLGQLLARLRTAGLVESTRGPGGGCTLGRAATAISVADIVVAVEAGAPGTDEDDGRPSPANDLSQWQGAVMQVHTSGIALADLVAGQHDAGALVEVRPRHGVAATRTHAGIRHRQGAEAGVDVRRGHCSGRRTAGRPLILAGESTEGPTPWCPVPGPGLSRNEHEQVRLFTS